jgi:hypothetical protein
MADKDGGNNIPEIGIEILRTLLKTAWEKNSGDDFEGVLPCELIIAPGTPVGPHVVAHGQVDILLEEMCLEIAPAGNGVVLGISTAVDLATVSTSTKFPWQNPFNTAAWVSITAPLDIVKGRNGSARIVFEGMPRHNVEVSLQCVDPLASLTAATVRSEIHGRWKDHTIPHFLSVADVNYGLFSADALLETFDDPGDETCRIIVSQPAPDHLKISIPVYMRMNNITDTVGIVFESPMGVQARIAITAPLVCTRGGVTAQLSMAVVDLDRLKTVPDVFGDSWEDLEPEVDLTGAACDEEAAHYYGNRLEAYKCGIDLDGLLGQYLLSIGQDLAWHIGDIVIPLPTEDEIETLIGDQMHEALLNRRYIGACSPGSSDYSTRQPVAGRPPDRWRSPFIEILNGPGGSCELSVKAVAMRSMISDCLERISVLPGHSSDLTCPPELPHMEGK